MSRIKSTHTGNRSDVLGRFHVSHTEIEAGCQTYRYLKETQQAFPTRMVYLYYISRLRYTILVGNPGQHTDKGPACSSSDCYWVAE